MIYSFLLILCALNLNYAKEGDSCVKQGVLGVCSNLWRCPDAVQDIENKIKPQHCVFGTAEPIVCCTSFGSRSHDCILPPYPKNGSYVASVTDGQPGDSYNFFTLNVTCSAGHEVDRSRTIVCQGGWWSEPMPKCVSACQLEPLPSIEYTCLSSDGKVNVSRACRDWEPHGVIASPRCRAPHYSSPDALGLMTCVNGSWVKDDAAKYNTPCKPVCGIVAPHEEVVGGKSGRRGEVPWHAGIYTKTTTPFSQICGGSLISARIIITAAHFFWKEEGAEKGEQPASNYAVGVGKLYRGWHHAMDEHQAQYSDVKELYLPKLFNGSDPTYEHNIAILMVSNPFEFKTHIWPLCADFRTNKENEQLQPGNKGKFAGWGFPDKNNIENQRLKVIDVPFNNTDTCRSEAPAEFLPFFTADKMCAGAKDGSIPLCKWDTGGGLAFSSVADGITRYYLRGILSLPPATKDCNTKYYSVFTQLTKQKNFYTEIRTARCFLLQEGLVNINEYLSLDSSDNNNSTKVTP